MGGVGEVGCEEALQPHVIARTFVRSLPPGQPAQSAGLPPAEHAKQCPTVISDAHPGPAPPDLPLSRWESRFPTYSAPGCQQLVND